MSDRSVIDDRFTARDAREDCHRVSLCKLLAMRLSTLLTLIACLSWTASLTAQTVEAEDVSKAKRFAQRGLSPSGIADWPDGAEAWAAEIKAAGKEAALLEALTPTDAKNSRAAGEYGYVCELLGKREDAMASYRKALALRRTYAGPRMRLFLLTHGEEKGLLDKMKLTELSQLGGAIMEKFVYVEDLPQEEQANRYEMVIRYLKGAKGAERLNLGWVLEVAFKMQADAAQKERYFQLCDAMLDVPPLAQEGFSRLLPQLKTDEEILGAARRGTISQSQAARGFRSADYGIEGPPLHSPDLYLIRHAWSNKNLDWLDEEILPQLEREAGVKAAKAFSDRKALYQCEETDFPELALSLAGRRAVKRARVDPNLRWNEVMQAWRERKLTVPLTPLLEDYLPAWMQGQAIPNGLALYGEGILAGKGSSGLKAWLGELATLFEIDLSKKLSPEGFQPPDGMPANVETFYAAMRVLSGHEKLTWHMLEFYEEQVAPVIPLKDAQPLAIDLRAHPLRSAATYEDLLATTKLLRASPFLGTSQTFRTFPRSNGLSSFFTDVIAHLSRLEAADQRLFKAMFSNETEGFGRSLIMAALEREPVNATVAFLTSAQGTIEEMSHERQTEVAYYLNRLVPPHLSIDGFAEEEKAMIKWLRLRPNMVPGDAVDAFLAAKSLSALGLTTGQLQSQAKVWLKGLAGDRERADQVFWKALELAESQGEDPTTFATDLAARVMTGAESLQTFDLCAEWISRPGNHPVMRKSATLFVKPLTLALDLEQESLSAQMADYVQQVNEALRPASIPLAFDGLWQTVGYLGDADERRYAELAAWLEKSDAAPELERLLTIIVKLQWHAAALLADERELAANEAREAMKDALDDGIEDAPNELPAEQARPEKPDLDPVWKDLAAVIADEQLTPTGSLAVAESILDWVHEIAPIELAEAAGKHLQAQWQAQGPVMEKQVFTIAQALAAQGGAEEIKRALLGRWWRTLAEDAEVDGGLTNAMFTLSLQGGEETIRDGLIERFPNFIDFEWLRLLVAHEAFAIAARLLKEDWNRFDWSLRADSESIPPFGEDDASKSVSLVTHVENRELGFWAKALYAALPSPPTESEEDSRPGRLIALAKEAEAMEWQDAHLREACLSMIALEKRAPSHASQAYAAASAGLSLIKLREMTDLQSRTRTQRVWTAHLGLTLREGPQVMRQLLEETLQLESEPARQATAAILLPCLESAWLTDWSRWKANIRADNLALLLLAADLDPDRWLPLEYAMRMLGDDMENLRVPVRIRQAKTEEDEEPPVEAFYDRVFGDVQEAIRRADLEEEALAELAARFSKSKRLMDGLKAYPQLYEQWLGFVLRNDWITKEKLLAEAPKWAKEAPRDGWAWREAAKVQTNAEQDQDALFSWNEAVKHTGKDPKRYSVFQLGRINMLFKLNMADDAAQALKAFDEKRLHPDSRDEYEFLKKRAQPRPNSKSPLI